jgi:ABC-type transport system substrate-binding protein
MNKKVLRFFCCILAFSSVELFAFEIRYPISSKQIAIDPTADLSSDSSVIRNQIFEGLVRISQDYSIEPSLAMSWKISLDGLNYEFKLRESALWQDGTLVTGDQICSFYKSLIYSKPKQLWMFSGLKGLDSGSNAQTSLADLGIKCAKQTVSFEFSVPNSQFLAILASAGARIGRKVQKNWIGTGQYRLQSQGKDIISLVKNKYATNIANSASNLIFEKFAGSEDISQLILSKKFDLFPVSSRELAQKIDPSEYALLPAGSFHLRLLLFNNKSRKTKDLTLRTAIATGLNRKEIADKSGAVDSSIAGSLNPSEFLRPKFSDFIPRFDSSKAVTLIKNSGFVGAEIEFLYSLRGQGKTVETPPLIASSLKEIGLNVKELRLDYEEYLRRIFSGNFEVALINFKPDYPSIDAFYYPLLFTNAVNNFVGFSNSEFDSLNTLARQEKNSEKLPGYYDKLNKILFNEVPLVPLFRNQAFLVHKKNLKIPINELGIGFLDFSKISATTTQAK